MPTVETQDTIYRGTTFVPNDVRESTSLLGLVGRGMRLRVSRDATALSAIVELASRKCLVGSAPNCDLRVNEPGVAPIECLIFHGAKNNVVRWLDTPRGFAGGEFFEDEILRVGDPLQVGPVELELLIDEIMEADEPARSEELSGTSEDRLAEYISRLERLETQLNELQQASEATVVPDDASDSNDEVVATITALATQLAGLQSRSLTDRDLWAGEKAELEALLQSRLREFDLLQNEVECLRDELVTVRNEYGNALANEAASERLAEVSQELAERTDEFEQQQTNWGRERSELQRHLQANLERLEQFEAQLSEQNARQTESEMARQAAEAKAERLQESVEELSERLAEQQAEYEKVRAQWEADRASLESELAETKERLAQSATTESIELELREAWNRERAELQRQVDEAVLRAEEVQEELEAQRRELGELDQSHCDSQPEDRSFEQPMEAAERPPDQEIIAGAYNVMDRLRAASSFGNDQNGEFADRIRNFVSPAPKDSNDAASEYPTDQYVSSAFTEPNFEEQPLGGLPPAANLDVETDEEEMVEDSLLAAIESQNYTQAFETEHDEEQELAFETQSPAPPVSAADVLAKLGQSDAWDDDESNADDSNDLRFAEPETAESQYAPPQCGPTQCGPTQRTPVAETPFNSLIGNDADEESIEAYMARLMNRVRATDDRDEPFRNPELAVVRSPSTEYTEVKEANQLDRAPEPEKFNPEEYKPRSQAPEVADGMTAMRTLANDSARTAIASHAKRNWSSVMKLKLLVSVFAFVSVLASIIFFWGNPILMGLAVLIGVGVLIDWARTAITYRRLLLDSLMLEAEGSDYDDLPSDEEAA